MSLSLILLIIALIALYGLFYYAHNRFAQEASRGKIANATIAERWETTDKNGKPLHYIRYGFITATGATREGDLRIHDAAEWQMVQKTDEVQLVNHPMSARNALMTKYSFDNQREILRKALIFYPFAAIVLLALSYSGAR